MKRPAVQLILLALLLGALIEPVDSAATIIKSLPIQVTPALVLSPSNLILPSVPLNTSSGPQTVTITNVGPQAFLLSAFSLGGADPGDFATTTDCTTLAPGASCHVFVTFTPTASGTRSASLTAIPNNQLTGHIYSAMLVGGGSAPMSLMVNVSPPAETIACSLAPGSSVAMVSILGGDGNAVTLSLTGDTGDFVLSSSTPPANVIVAPGGISLVNCGTTVNVTVTASQP